MESCYKEILLHSPAAQMLVEFIAGRREKRAEETGLAGMNDLEGFEEELHGLVMALECELLGEELGRYDVTAEEIEVEGKVYRRGVRLPETYMTAAGRVSVERHLYYAVGEKGKGICPLELRCGLIGGYFTPRAARQGAFAMAHLTPGESEKLFAEMGNMRPSRSTLDRLAKVISPEWESQRVTWEAQLRQAESVPAQAKVIVISVDGVMAPMRSVDKPEKAQPAGKQASGPLGYKEVGCGTVALYDQEAERLQTVRYARMPESKKGTLQEQLEAEAVSVLALRPDLQRVHLADGAKDNWRLLDEIENRLPAAAQAPIQILDFYHACDHLKNGCDAAWGESTLSSQAAFERLKTRLKEADNGVEIVIRTLRFQHHLTTGNKRRRLEVELTYFSHQRQRMRYAHYLRQHLPIASGVMEASCKTLVTQRLKRSGMVWSLAGGQAILTLRSLIQSNRWSSAWKLVSAHFCKAVSLPKQPTMHTPNWQHSQPLSLSNFAPTFGFAEYDALPFPA